MSSSTPTRVCVIGAGTMGSGIAAHLANLGFSVTLLDQTVEGARAALDRAKSLRPPHFYDPIIADSVRIGSVAENLAWVAESDWVCEAIYENMDAKRSLYQSIEAVLPESCYISTNTSGLEIRDLVEGRSDAFKKKFIGTHFFNPPRYLKLLELIPTEFTDPAITLAFTRLMEDSVGRRVVVAKDTPGFIANRYGMWCMFHATHVAEKLRLSPEQVDAITGPFLGRPRTGSFRLNDLVGLDIMQDIANNLFQRCAEDPHRDVLKAPKSLQFLFDKGHLGTKSGMGYYRKEGRELLTFDLETQAYRQQQDPNLPSLVTLGKLPLGERIRQALLLKDEVGEFMRLYLPAALRYADYLKEEISFNVEDFDRVMMWGFGWETGPFGLVDAIGADNLGWDKRPFYEGATMRDFSGNYVARKVQPEFADIRTFPVLETRTGFCIRDLGADVKAISLTSKMGTISTDLCLDLIDWLQPQVGCLVFASEARHFSLGFDLTIFEKAISEGNPDEIERGILALQEAASLLATKRVVAAVHGYCLGGGLELVMPCAQVISHSEAQIGLPEIKVGLLPGGAGNVVLRQRGSQTVKDIVAMAKSIMTGAVSTNAYQAKTLGYLRSSDVIATHPDRILYDAKHLALKVEVQPQPVWNTPSGPIIGMVDQLIADLENTQDWATYDLQVAESVKHVFTKSTSAEDARHREREEFLRLCRNGMTYERIKHMLENGKPLRN